MGMDKQELIASLSYPGNRLPEEALRETGKRYNEIRPELHAALQLSPDAVESIEAESEAEYMLQFFAMYLAAENRDRDAFPLIRDLFAEYGEAVSEIAGDMICEHLDRILASVCDDPEALMTAADLPGLDIWVRSAFFGALGILCHLGHLERKQLSDWFRDRMQNDDLHILERTSIAHICCDLALRDLEPLLHNALQNEHIDPTSMSDSDITEAMQRHEMEDYSYSRYRLVDDSIDLLRLWYRDDDPDIYSSMFEPEEVAPIASILREYNIQLEEEASISPAYLHGYFFAVVLTPEPLSANEWLPHLFGGEMPPFDSIDDANAKLAVLMQLYNRLNQLRLEGQLFCPFEAGRGTDQLWLDAVQEWCKGFLLATGLRQEYWSLEDEAAGAEDVNTAMIALLAIGHDAVLEEIVPESDDRSSAEETEQKRREFLAHAIITLPHAVQKLSDHCLRQDRQRVASMQPAKSHKVGRNHPCPCGSGKKFKRCCGAPGRSVH